MKKVIAAINMTIDGNCDHMAGLPDEEIHQHYTDLLDNAEVVLYGRTTYQLMQYWQTLLQKPSGDQTLDDFAKTINQIQKIVFSHTLKSTGWETAQLANLPLQELVKALKQSHTGGNKDILVGSRSLIIQLLNLNLIDEFQLCIHPVVGRKGLPLFEDINDRTIFKLNNTKHFASGAVVLYYQPAK